MATRKKSAAARPRKPTYASVTTRPCKCGFLERTTDEPSVPIKFDVRMNEYHIEHVGEGRGGHSMVYHCPFCGGAAPPSRRQTFFATITSAETQRLSELTADVKTIAEVLARFGEPDDDMDPGTTIYEPAKGNQPPRVVSYRTLGYRCLSATADVLFTDYGPDRGIRMSLNGKCRGETTE